MSWLAASLATSSPTSFKMMIDLSFAMVKVTAVLYRTPEALSSAVLCPPFTSLPDTVDTQTRSHFHRSDC